jgi:hypothetical protein
MNETTKPAPPESFIPNAGMFLRPDHLPPSAWTGHIPFGAWMVAALRPRLLVELGTHHGASYLALCQAVEENGLETRCLAVDTWAGDEHAGAYGDEVYDTLRRTHDPRYARFSELLRMTFDEALECVADGSVDLLHIDGLHTYDAVKHDFDTWERKLSDRAVVLFHDTQVRDRGFGVWRFWDEVRARFPAFEFVHSHGLGVLIVGADAPRAVRDLARLGDAERTRVQTLFERLGEGLQFRAAAEELEKVAAGREEGVTAYRAHATALEAQVAELQGESAALRDAVAARQAEIDALKPAITAMQHEVVGLRNDVAAREDGLDKYRTHARALEMRLAEMDAQVIVLQADIAETRQAMQAAAAERERMASTYASATAEMVRQHSTTTDEIVRRHAETTEDMLRRLEEAHANLMALSVEIQRMLQSRSWRATAWLRKLASWTRGQA